MGSRILGIDIGAYAVKVAVVAPGFRQPQVQSVLTRRVPDGDEPHQERAMRALAALLAEAKLTDVAAYAAVSGTEVFIHVLEFPFKTLKRSDLNIAVGTELEGLLPVDLENLVYSFEQLPKGIGAGAAAGPTDSGPTGDDEPTAVRPAPGPPIAGRVAEVTEGMRVLACAMPTERAREKLEAFDAAGVEARGLIASVGGYKRAAERIAACETSRVGGPYVAIIDVGHDSTEVCVVIDERVDYARSIARAGRHFTDAIAREWNMDRIQAEAAKEQDGFIGSAAMPPSGEAWQRVHDVLRTEVEPLARDIKRSLSACQAKTGAVVTRAVLVGGGGRIRGLPEYLSERLGFPVTRPSIADEEKMVGGELMRAGVTPDTSWLACGIAIEGGTGRPSFDLRTGELAFKADLSFLRAKANTLAIGALVVFAFGLFAGFTSWYRLKSSRAKLEDKLAEQSKRVFKKQMTAAEVLEQIAPTGPAASPIPTVTAYDTLLAFNAALPARSKVKIDVRNIEIKGGKVQITATSFPTDKSEALAGIEALEESLKKSKCLSDVTIGKNETGDEGARDFSMTIKQGC